MLVISLRMSTIITSITLMCTLGTIHGTILVPLPQTPPNFPYVLSKVFDRATGTLYVGFDVGTTTLSTGNNAISKIYRPSGLGTSTLIGIASGTIASQSVFALALAGYEGDPYPYIACLFGASTSPQVGIINNSATITQILASLIPYDPTATAIPNSLAANKCYLFAGLWNSSAEEPASGIAVICIHPTTLALTQAAAEPGSDVVRARELDSATPEVGTNAQLINGYTLVWDNKLERLYIGYAVSNAPSSPARSVIVAHTECDTLLYSPIVPDTVYPLPGSNENIITTDSATKTTLAVYHLGVLHASTGPSYLIVNGGDEIAGNGNTHNYLYALPLVDNPSDEITHGTMANKDSALINGKFVTPATAANELPTILDHSAQVGAGPLHFDPSLTQVSDMVVVGDTVYVTTFNQPDTKSETGIFYSQALFDSEGKISAWTPWTKRAFPLGCGPDISCPCRIKLFDVDAVTGKLWGIGGDTQNLIATTAWNNGTTCCCPQPITHPCQSQPHQSTPLVVQLNKTLSACCTPCYSVLDLDASTRGFSNFIAGEIPLSLGTPNRYALFGGNGTVAFARISETDASLSTILTYTNGVQNVIHDFSLPTNYRLTHLPAGAGCVTVLEYSRRVSGIGSEEPVDEGLTNYFFAGTPTGLYVFPANTPVAGSGFSNTALTTLDQFPFDTGNWIKAPNIPGAIIDVKTTGQALYVLTRETSCQKPCTCTLYKIPFDETVADMFAPANVTTILAQTKTPPVFDHVSLFTGIQIVVAQENLGLPPLPPMLGVVEEIVLTTNHGIYQTTTENSAHLATDQTDAAWIQLDEKASRMYLGVAGIDNTSLGIIMPLPPLPVANYATLPSTVWPFSIDDTKCREQVYQRSSIHQLGFTYAVTEGPSPEPEITPGAFVPPHYNDSLNCFKSLFPITYYWTDGARRFFIVRSNTGIGGRTQLMVLPFDIKEWNVCNPDLQIIKDAAINTICDYYWVRHIGVSGILMAGTSAGVVALE